MIYGLVLLAQVIHGYETTPRRRCLDKNPKWGVPCDRPYSHAVYNPGGPHAGHVTVADELKTVKWPLGDVPL